MRLFPDSFFTVEQLDEFISRPSNALLNFVTTLSEDIVVLGASGKMGVHISMMLQRAIQEAGLSLKVYAVAKSPIPILSSFGVNTIQTDLFDLEGIKKIPIVKNVIYMVGRKFGSTGNEYLSWAVNTVIPANVARVFNSSDIVSFSTGCVYPIVDISSDGSKETDEPNPIGEYAMSCLGRERVFDYYANTASLKIIHIRLNYSIELRYGVLVDIAQRVYNNEPVDLTTGYFNCIWQGDACNQIIQCLRLTGKGGTVINVTGSEKISVKWVAEEFAKLFQKKAIFNGQQSSHAYISDSSKAKALFGNPEVSLHQMLLWISEWVKMGGQTLGKPTHFEVQNGKY